MEFYTARKIKRLPEIKEQPEVKSRVFRATKDKLDFAVQLLLDNTFSHPIANTLYVLFILLSLALSIYSGDYSRFIIALGIVVVIKIRLTTAYLNLYDAYNDKDGKAVLHTIDSEGVHAVMKANYKRYIRLSTTRWEDVDRISVTEDFMSIQVVRNKRKETPFEISYIWSEDISQVRNLVLYYWKRALDSKEEDRYVSYEDDEVKEVMAFVEEQFGDFETLRGVSLPDIKLAIAIVPPAQDRDYYTLCTIGGGAYRMGVPNELHLEHGIVEYAEHMMVLPSWWKVDNESLEDERWYWPFRTLFYIAHYPKFCKSWYRDGQTIGLGNPVHEELPYNNMLIVPPMMFEHTIESIVGLSSGKSVGYYQIVPITDEELEMKQQGKIDELWEKLFGAEGMEAIPRQLERLKYKE